MVVLGTKTYGQEGRETIDTKKELAFALREKKDIVVLRMTEAYSAPFAIMQLPGLQSIEWPKGSPLAPSEAMEYILARVQRDEAVAKSNRHLGGEQAGEGTKTAAPEEVVIEEMPARLPPTAVPASSGTASLKRLSAAVRRLSALLQPGQAAARQAGW